MIKARLFKPVLFVLTVMVLSACVDDLIDAFEESEQPEVLSINPSDGDLDVSVDTEIVVTMSNDIDENSVTSSSFRLYTTSQSGEVSGSRSVSGKKITFVPSSLLSANTTYTVALNSQISDTDDLPLATSFTSIFTTASGISTGEGGENTDTTAPTVTQVSPVSNSTNISRSSNIVVTFSEDVKSSSVTSSSFTVKANSTTISGNLTVSGNRVTFNPTSDFAASTKIIVTVKDDVTDLAGNKLASDYLWAFTTAASTSLTVNSWIPGAEAKHVAIDDDIVITFSDDIESSSVTSNTVYLTKGGASVDASLSVSGNKVTLNPSSALIEFNTTYTLTVKSSVTSTDGSTMSSAYSKDFETILVDDGYYYRIYNLYVGKTKSFDTSGSGVSFSTFMGTTGNYSGQNWNIVKWTSDPNSRYFYLTTITGGESNYLTSGSKDGSDKATLLPDSGSGLYQQQLWYFAEKYVAPSDGLSYYRLRNYFGDDAYELNHESLFVTAGNYSGHLWTFVRLGKK